MTHAKGPWEVGKDPHNIVSKNPPIVIAEVNPLRPNKKANASLIAAAPEMLEALEIMIQVSREISIGISGANPMSSEYLLEQAKIVEEIVKKARGEI